MFVRLLAVVALVAACLPAHAGGGLEVEFHRSQAYAERGLPLSEAVRVGDRLLLSGQLGFVPGGGLAEGGIEAETRQAMDNIGRLLAAHGLGFGDVVKCLVMLADIDEWPAFNRVYAGYFSDTFPARSALGGVQLVAGARVEVECEAAFRAARREER
jgi:2-iminobutanoate/2-iminopropanoate deaminase